MNIIYNKQNKKLKTLMTTQQKQYSNNEPHKFQNRVQNLSNITFTDTELKLLNKGLQYNLQQQHKEWIEQLALEAETAISKLNILEQDHYRHLVANNIKTLITREQRPNTLYKEEWNIIRNIKNKIKEHDLIITKADKGKTIIIMEQHEYKQHIEEFIKENNYTLLQHNPTKQYQKIIMNTINKSNIHVNKSNKHKFYNPNTEAPTIRATIKIHKNPIKIRPTVNWKNAPAYQLATQTSQILTQYIQLPNTFNITQHNLWKNLKLHQLIQIPEFVHLILPIYTLTYQQHKSKTS
jgi:hypothetical protein